MISGSLTPLYEELDAIAEPGQYVGAAVPEIKAFYRGTTAAGTAPDGTPWEKRKSDGGTPLQNAYDAIDVRQVSSTQAVIELKGHHVFPHYGAKGHPVRQIINKEVDEKLGNAIRRGVVKPFKERSK